MENKSAAVETQMAIRKSAEEVFNAFIDPEITKNFWFTKSTGKLELHKEITWTWEMYQVSAIAKATEITPYENIKFDWIGNGETTQVQITFKTIAPQSTYVSITHKGFIQSGEELMKTLKDSTGGFTMVLAGLKAYLEHGIKLNLIGDKFPEELR